MRHCTLVYFRWSGKASLRVTIEWRPQWPGGENRFLGQADLSSNLDSVVLIVWPWAKLLFWALVSPFTANRSKYLLHEDGNCCPSVCLCNLESPSNPAFPSFWRVMLRSWGPRGGAGVSSTSRVQQQDEAQTFSSDGLDGSHSRSNMNASLCKQTDFIFKKDSSLFPSSLCLIKMWSSIQFTDCKSLDWFNTFDLFSSLHHLLKIRSSLLFRPQQRLNCNWARSWIHFSLFC